MIISRFFYRKSSRQIAKDRLKILLISDRVNCSPEMMEMIKTDEVVFRQGEPLGPIWIYRKKNNMQYADEMANEAFYLSPDPPVDPGLLEIVRKREEHLALQKNATIDAVMREVVLWATSGKIVKEEDIMAMLEGKVALSENEPEKNESESSEINESQTEISENEPTLEPTLEQTEPAEKS